MNLEYAAYLLNENQYLVEDADGEGRSKAKAWLKKNFPFIEFGETPDDMTDSEGNPFTTTVNHQPVQISRIDDILEHARMYFGHWLYNGLRIPHDANVSIYKYLPGVIRVAFTDCGWYTSHQDNNKLHNLRYIYAAAYIDWIEGQQENPNYKGKVSKDFTLIGRNGQPQGEPMSYEQLLAEFKPMFAHVDEKFEEATARVRAENGGALPQEQEEPQETEEERLAREEQERIDNSMAGEYHIEYIPDWETSKQWLKYTNPTAEQAGNPFNGARWCITEIHGHWNHYQTFFSPDVPTIYYCWKAPSLDALLEMNDHVADYDGDRDIKHLPFSEYGLSLICIMVTKDRDNPSNVKMLCATSRYNHCDSHGNKHLGTTGDDTYYGDQLCIDGGKAQACQILGITEEQFNRKFKPIKSEGNGNENIDHTVLNQYLNDPEAMFTHADCTLDTGCIYLVKHQGEFNFYNNVSKQLLSPTNWFTKVVSFFNESVDNTTAIVRFIKNNKTFFNIIDNTGRMLIDIDIPFIDVYNKNYAIIELNRGPEPKYNIVKRSNGMPLLKKPYDDIILQSNYGVSIPVKEGNIWKAVDFKGKTTIEFGENVSIQAASTKNIYVIETNNKYKFINKKTNKVIYEIKHNLINNIISDYEIAEAILIEYTNGTYNIINADKGLLLPTDSEYTNYPINILHGYYTVKDSVGFNILRPDGKLLFETSKNIRSDDICIDNINQLIAYRERIHDRLSDNKWILMDIDGNIISDDFKYRIITTYQLGNNYLLCKNMYNEFNIFNIAENNFMFSEHIVNIMNAENRKFIMFGTNDNKFGIITADGILLNNGFNTDIIGASYIGEDCILVAYRNNQYNIFTLAGKKLFKYNFKRLVASFNEDGIGIINAGNNNYYINSYGDVSRVIENITESIYINTNNPIINENMYSHWIKNAAFLLD